MFWKYHNEGVLKKYKPKLQVGSLDSKPKAAAPAPAPAPKPAPKPEPKKAEPAKAAASAPAPEALDPFGALIPFADPSWYQGVSLQPPTRKTPFSLRQVAGTLMLTPLAPVPLPLLQRVPRRPPC